MQQPLVRIAQCPVMTKKDNEDNDNVNADNNDVDNNDDTEKQFTALKEKMTKAAEEVLLKKKRVQKQPWMTEEILEKMEKRKIAKSLDPEKYNHLKKEVERECIKARDEWWNGKCEEVEELESKHESRVMHKKIKQITGQGFRKR